MDFRTSLDFFTQSAELKYPPAINKLGDIYFQGGPSLSKDFQKSLSLYKEAA
jgi:TPR repeat protein